MKSVLALIGALLLVVARGDARPSPPESVLQGSEEIRHLWDSAQVGVFLSELPERYRGPVQDAWAAFLEREGAGIVDDYYK